MQAEETQPRINIQQGRRRQNHQRPCPGHSNGPCEFVVQRRPAGHGPTLFTGLSEHLDLKLVSRLEFGSGAVAVRYEPRR